MRDGRTWQKQDSQGKYARDRRVVFTSHFFSRFRHFWRKSLRILEPGFYSISSFWPSLPSGIDAAYEVISKDTVFIFKGKLLYKHFFHLLI
jgi:hypothetical protein